MAVIAKGVKSYHKKEVDKQKTKVIGFKKTVFAHKAAAGETGISVGGLNLPSEMVAFTNPSYGEILTADIKTFRSNVRITSSLRGPLMDYLSYDIPVKTRIDWVGFTAEEGEIFIVEIDSNARTGMRIVDAAPLVATGTLAAGVEDFSVGATFEINKYPAAQVGAVLVFLDGQLQFRNTGNAAADASADGNYEEVDSGNGYGTLIRFNETAVEDRSVVVISNGVLVEKPNESQMSEIEKVQGQVDKLVQTVAALAGVPTTDFQAAPSQVQLGQFGDRVIALEEVTETGQIPGITTGEEADSGSVGEYIDNGGATVAVPHNTSTRVHTYTLPAGDWDVWGYVNFTVTGADNTTEKILAVCISQSDAVIDEGYYDVRHAKGFNVTGFRTTVPVRRIKISSSTPVYFNVSQYQFAGTAGSATNATNPRIFARRRR